MTPTRPLFCAAIDQGTTSTRCMIFDHSGSVVAAAQKEHRQIFPQPGWVEHDPLEIWQRTQEVVRQALSALYARPGLENAALAAVGVTNQRETTIVWDRRTGQPLYNAIVWQDTRTADICARLAAEGGQDRFRARTGLPLSTYFSGPKLKWLLDNVPEVRRAAQNGDALFGTVDTWLIWNLTGAGRSNPGRCGAGVAATGVAATHVTDVTNASRTLLMNLATLDWDAEILDTLGIPASMLPRIVPSSDPQIWGYTDPAGPFGQGCNPGRCGLGCSNPVPVCGDLGDQQAALVGQACFAPGDAKNTYGTGCFMLLNTGERPVASQNGLLTTLAYRFGAQPAVYALEGSIAISGALVQWLRDNLGLIAASAEVESLARSVDDNGGVYIVPAFSGLFAPYWRADARGAILGLTRYVTKGHLARAALEATAYQTCEVLDAMRTDSSVAGVAATLTGLKVDGGMVGNELLMQFQADMLGVPVARPVVAETTALGAAYAAGLAVGFWRDLDDLRANWQVDRTWQPQMAAETRQRLYRGWLKAVQRTFDWVE